MEERIIRAVLYKPDVAYSYAHQLKPQMFIEQGNEIIIQEILNLLEAGEKLSKSSLCRRLKDENLITKITELKPVSGVYKVQKDIQQLHSRFIRNELGRLTSEVADQCLVDVHTDSFEIHQGLQSGLDKMLESVSMKGDETIKDITDRSIQQLESAISNKNKGQITGITSGVKGEDAQSSGYQNTDLIILAARPGMGKTGKALNIIRVACIEGGTPMAFFSLEMNAVQLVQRLSSQLTGISVEKMRSGELGKYDHEALIKAHKTIAESPLTIDDTSSISLLELSMKAKKFARRDGVKMIIVDYLQLMRADAGTREQEVSKISAGLKALAKDLNIPVLALAQLSRQVEQRGGSKIPMLSDLRESGSIEQDADIVQFLYRPEYYGMMEDEEGNSTVGVAYLFQRKNRHGAPFKVKMNFTGSSTKFEDHEQVPQFQDAPFGSD